MIRNHGLGVIQSPRGVSKVVIHQIAYTDLIMPRRRGSKKELDPSFLRPRLQKFLPDPLLIAQPPTVVLLE